MPSTKKLSQIRIPKKIKKRDGRVVDFNINRITEAVFKAFEASGKSDRKLACEIKKSVLEKLDKKYKKKSAKSIPTIEELQDFVEESLIEKGFAKVAKSYILYRQKRSEIRREKQEILNKEEIDEVDKLFDPNALRVLKSRYLCKNEKGDVTESPKTLFERVAIHTVLPDILYDKKVSKGKKISKKTAKDIPQEELTQDAFDFIPALEKEKAVALEDKLKIGKYVLNRFHVEGLYRVFKRFEKEERIKVSWEKLVQMFKANEFEQHEQKIISFYTLLVRRNFMPNTPAIANFGSYLGMGSACFALDIDDSIDSIMGTLKEASIVFKSGGGLGYNFSKLRPEGDFIKTTGGTSSGPLSFMRLFDTMTEVVKQGGIRRGANMGIMNCLAAKTEISTIEGRKQIKELIGTRPYLYCLNNNRKIQIRQADKIIHSGKKNLVRVWFDDDTHLDCTPDHRIMLSNGQYRHAQDLKCLDSVMAFNKKILNERYFIGATSCELKPEHIVSAECHSGVFVAQTGKKRKPKDLCVHHKNDNPLNNHPDNLQIITISEHAKIHSNVLLENQKRIAVERKGKTIEEVYGAEKAVLWKKKMSQARKRVNPWNKGFCGERYKEHYEDGFKNQHSCVNANHKVVKVEKLKGLHDIYDVIMDEYHNFVANGIFVHNSNHPDIEKFVVAKAGNKSLKNFNISILIMPDFWEHYKKDKPYPLKNPRTGEVHRYISPRMLFGRIVYQAWESAEPGVLFHDRINDYNPLAKSLGPIVTTNPCVPPDTWVMTSEGPRQVKELIGQKTEVVVNNKKWSNHGTGFFFTGEKRVLKLKTKEGFELSLTGNHLVRFVKKITRWVMDCEWKPAIELKLGDKIILNQTGNFEWSGQHGEKEGYLMGHLIGDGVIYKKQAMLESWGDSNAEKKVRELIESYVRNFPHRKDFRGWMHNSSKNKYRLITASFSKLVESFGISNKKQITSNIERESSDFYRGFLKGFFDTDGSVQGSQKKGVSVRLAQSDLLRLQAVQRMLLNLGIFSKIYTNRRKAGLRKLPDGKGGLKFYKTKAQHELVVSGNNLSVFCSIVGFENSDKQEKLEKLLNRYKRKLNKERFFATVSDITKGEVKKVYDIQIPGINAFGANGVCVHNCGELLLYPNESCNLGSLNLWSFVKVDENEKKYLDWEELSSAVRLAVRFLDNVIDVNKLPLNKIEEMTLLTRKIGLGIMGLGDLFFELEIPYNSKKGRNFMERIAEFINYYSKLESIELSKERGPFPLFRESFYADGKLPFRGFCEKKSWSFDWKAVAKEIKKHGIRNSYTTVIAPTGSISMIAGCSSGIEPVYSLVYQKKVAVGTFYYVDAVFEKAMLREELFDENLINDVINANGSIQSINYIPPDFKKYFVVSHDIKPEDHIKSLASFQKWTDSSISKTINFPKEATAEDMKSAYLFAYEHGCKGVTVYRDTSISEQVMSTNDAKSAEKAFEKKRHEKLSDSLQRHKDVKAEGMAVYRDPSAVYMNGEDSLKGHNNGKITHCPSCKVKLSFHEGCGSCPICGWGLCA